VRANPVTLAGGLLSLVMCVPPGSWRGGEHMADCRDAHAGAPVTTIATVLDLFVYPVKSARAIARSRVRVAASGFEWDRQWMLVDARGTFLSQRTHPQLARIVPEIGADALVLHAPDVPALRVPLDNRGEPVPVLVWKDACMGVDQGEAAHAWASRVTGEAVRLVRVAPDMASAAHARFAGTTPAPLGFADGYPLLVCSQASLEDLDRRLPRPVPIERFR